MPRALPPAVRKAIWRRFESGKHPAEIAAEFEVSVRTVHRLIDDVESERMEWVVSDARGQQLRSVQATEIRRHAVRTLNLKPTWRK